MNWKQFDWLRLSVYWGLTRGSAAPGTHRKCSAVAHGHPETNLSVFYSKNCKGSHRYRYDICQMLHKFIVFLVFYYYRDKFANLLFKFSLVKGRRLPQLFFYFILMAPLVRDWYEVARSFYMMMMVYRCGLVDVSCWWWGLVQSPKYRSRTVL